MGGTRNEWSEDWESGTYPIHSGMSRVFYLPQHRTLSTRHPLALCCMPLTGWWVSADENLLPPHQGFKKRSSEQARIITSRPQSRLMQGSTLGISFSMQFLLKFQINKRHPYPLPYQKKNGLYERWRMGYLFIWTLQAKTEWLLGLLIWVSGCSTVTVILEDI